jgi:hypothetical protein
MEIFYRSGNGMLNWWFWNAGKGTWSHEWLGSPGDMGGEPTPSEKPDGSQEIYFGGSNGLLHWWWWNPSTQTWGLQWLTGALL